MSRPSKGYPATGFGDLLEFVARCVWDFAKAPRFFDLDWSLQNWFGKLVRRTGSDNIVVNLYVKRFLVVTGRDLSEHILAQPPDGETYVEGTTKARAMSFLAPRALTISHGERWRRLRRLNEGALRATEPDARMEFVLDAVRKAFPGPVSGIADIRKCMTQAMSMVVFGSDGAATHLLEDVQALVGYVGNPVRRVLLGWRERGRRKRFYDTLRRLWRESPPSDGHGLIAAAKEMARNGTHSEEELIQQIPHWMFTFAGSGAELLARTLAIVGSRDEVQERVRAEVREQGLTDGAAAIMKMDYLESCLLEACRLFPPVTRTFHVAPRGDEFNGVRISAGMEILHCFAASQRALSMDATANDFRPERWMERGSNARAIYPSLFLGGARDCPGKGLVLFVCKAAISMLVRDGRIRSVDRDLSEDPMPYWFPKRGLRLSTDSNN